MTTKTFAIGDQEFTEEIIHTDDQAYFDNTVRRLMDYPRTMNDNEECVYSGEIGCAVGCNIANSDLRLVMDEIGSLHMINGIDMAGVVWPDTTNGHKLADLLQKVHDGFSYYWDGDSLNTEGIQRLRNIAFEFNLEWNF